MPHTASTVRTLSRDIGFDRDEDVDVAMRRIDHAETDAVCRHLLGDLFATRSAIHSAPRATTQVAGPHAARTAR